MAQVAGFLPSMWETLFLVLSSYSCHWPLGPVNKLLQKYLNFSLFSLSLSLFFQINLYESFSHL